MGQCSVYLCVASSRIISTRVIESNDAFEENNGACECMIIQAALHSSFPHECSTVLEPSLPYFCFVTDKCWHLPGLRQKPLQPGPCVQLLTSSLRRHHPCRVSRRRGNEEHGRCGRQKRLADGTVLAPLAYKPRSARPAALMSSHAKRKLADDIPVLAVQHAASGRRRCRRSWRSGSRRSCALSTSARITSRPSCRPRPSPSPLRSPSLGVPLDSAHQFCPG